MNGPLLCFVPLPRFFSIWKSLHGSVNSIAERGFIHLRHGLEKRRRRTIPWRVEFQLRSPLQGMRFQGKTKETLVMIDPQSGWIIRYEFLFVKYDWKRWRELWISAVFHEIDDLNDVSMWLTSSWFLTISNDMFVWNKGSWVIQGRVIQAVGFLERLVRPFDSWKAVALTCFQLKTNLIPQSHHVIFSQNAQESWPRKILEPRVQGPNLSTHNLACLVASPL